jgi:lipopolysaccharide transport system ATP-binding protein
MAHQKLITLENVALGYRKRAFRASREPFWALRDVSFDLYHGECLGVIGRNGVGKSSLLKLLAGILLPDKGRVIRHGAFRSSLLTLQLGFSPQLSGRENVILSGMLLGLTRREIEQQMQGIIEFAELQEFIDEPLHSYSAGMKARLGFAVAIRSQPDLLLIDEVLGVGDEDFKERSSGVLHDWIRSDKTVVFVSHSTSSVRKNCDRLVWIENGLVAMIGAVEEVLAKYALYNHILKSLSNDLGVPLKEVRAQMKKTNPLEYLEQFSRRYREKLLAGELSVSTNKGTAQ